MLSRLNACALALLVLTVVAVDATPAAASSSRHYVVDTLEDRSVAGGCTHGAACSLRDAIFRADEYGSGDTIEFAVEGTIVLASAPLPDIVSPVTIDATTLAGYAGQPLVELDGSGIPGSGHSEGFDVDAGHTTIEGLAIGGFGVGISLGGHGPGHLCGNYIGTDPTGTEAKPNAVGVEILASSAGSRIGSECPEGVGGNLISGNSEFGIVNEGDCTEIVDNLIGVDAAAGKLPNGLGTEPDGGGVRVGDSAENTFVGESEAGGPGNTIAHNAGAGILVDPGATKVEIRRNSIFDNTVVGIAVDSSAEPAIESVAAAAGATTVTGTLSGAPETTFELDFFANEECGGSAQGQFFTEASEGGSVETDASGSATFAATLPALSPTARYVTATATDSASHSTSGFSNCLGEPVPEVVLSPAPPPSETAPSQILPIADFLTPVNGESVVVEPQSGRVLVRRPGERKFRSLKEGEEIPVGSDVDTTRGSTNLTSIDAFGAEQTALFYDGRFQVLQHDGAGLVILRLEGGNFRDCGGSAPEGSGAATSAASGRHLWGSGKGQFRTEGNYGSATVRGTIWLTEDRCGGTLVKVRRGVVAVRDFRADRTVSVPAGKSYLARSG